MLVLILFECVQALSMTTNSVIRSTILPQQSGAHITPTTEPGVSPPAYTKALVCRTLTTLQIHIQVVRSLACISHDYS
jgi:hypothetical protein